MPGAWVEGDLECALNAPDWPSVGNVHEEDETLPEDGTLPMHAV